MYMCVIVSTVDVNDCIFCVNEQQKVYRAHGRLRLPRDPRVSKGAYHSAKKKKKSGNFGLKSNGTVIFRKIRSEIED